MKIQDKLLEDKKRIVKDIDDVIAKLDEYINLIDALAKKIEFSKDVFEKIENISAQSYINGEMIYTGDALDAFQDMKLMAENALQKLNDE